MSLMDWVNIALSVIIVAGIVVFAIRAYINRNNIITPKHKKSHKRIETRLLNYILSDMRNNPHEWIATPYDPGMQREPHFINDKKNMAVVVNSAGKNSVVVKINITSAAKYMEHAEDVIATPISGDHVNKFLRKVDECIDTRGKELSFIERMLKDKL